MKKSLIKWRKTLIIGLVVAAIGLFLRLYNLVHLPVFADEAIYIRWAQIMRVESTLRFLPLSDGKQPLFMWGVIPFLKIFSDPLIAGRIVSVMTGIGTLVGIFLLTLELTKKHKLALAASLIYAVSPYVVFFDRIGLVDSMFSMFGIWTLFFAAKTAKTLRMDYAMFTGFFLGGALLTKSPAIFFVMMLPITWILAKWSKNVKMRLSVFAKLIFFYLTALTIGYGMHSIMRLGPNFHLLASRNLDYVLPLSHLWTNPKDPFLPYIDRVLQWFWQLGPSIIILFFVFGVYYGLKKWRKETVLLVVWALFPVFVQAMYAKAFTTRYVLFSLPPAIILASFAFRGLHFKGSRTLLKVGMIVFLLHALWIDRLLLINMNNAPLPRVMRSGYLEEWTSGIGIREASELIREEYNSNPEEKIVVGTEGYFGTLPDGLQMYLADLPEITVIGIGLGINQIPSQLVESRDFGNKTYLVVNSSRLLVEPEEIGLELVASFAKANRPAGFKEYIHFGPHDNLYLFRVK